MAKAKILTLKQLRAKRFNFFEELPAAITDSLGNLCEGVSIAFYGLSSNGKSSFTMLLVKLLAPFGKILYVTLEEGFAYSTQRSIESYLPDDLEAGVSFGDASMTYDELRRTLTRRNSAKFIFIDSVQYWRISFDQYKALKEQFKKKCFIYVMHEKSNVPKGGLADAIFYDVDVKIRIKKFLAFISSRVGGGKTLVIWEDGAKKYWKQNYKQALKCEGWDAVLPIPRHPTAAKKKEPSKS